VLAGADAEAAAELGVEGGQPVEKLAVLVARPAGVVVAQVEGVAHLVGDGLGLVLAHDEELLAEGVVGAFDIEAGDAGHDGHNAVEAGVPAGDAAHDAEGGVDVGPEGLGLDRGEGAAFDGDARAGRDLNVLGADGEHGGEVAGERGEDAGCAGAALAVAVDVDRVDGDLERRGRLFELHAAAAGEELGVAGRAPDVTAGYAADVYIDGAV